MKRTKLIYWLFTIPFGAFMLLAALPDIFRAEGAIMVFSHLGYPSYLLPFLGVAKLLGVIVVVVPGFNKLKEWAYAGLAFDLIGALYSHLSVGDPISVWSFALIGMILLIGSYANWNRLR